MKDTDLVKLAQTFVVPTPKEEEEITNTEIDLHFAVLREEVPVVAASKALQSWTGKSTYTIYARFMKVMRAAHKTGRLTLK